MQLDTAARAVLLQVPVAGLQGGSWNGGVGDGIRAVWYLLVAKATHKPGAGHLSAQVGR